MKVEATATGKNVHPLLKVENLVKRYTKRSLAGTPEELLALDSVSFTISRARVRWRTVSPAWNLPLRETFGSKEKTS